MKLELDVWHYLLDVYTKFEIDIAKYVEKSPENFNNPKHAKIISNIPKNVTHVEKYISGLLCTKFEEFILIYEVMIAKNEFDLFWLQSRSKWFVMQLNLNMSCHLLNVYTKFQIEISKQAEKSLENADRWTDGRTDGHSHRIICPLFKLVYKK